MCPVYSHTHLVHYDRQSRVTNGSVFAFSFWAKQLINLRDSFIDYGMAGIVDLKQGRILATQTSALHLSPTDISKSSNSSAICWRIWGASMAHLHFSVIISFRKIISVFATKHKNNQIIAFGYIQNMMHIQSSSSLDWKIFTGISWGSNKESSPKYLASGCSCWHT